MSEKEALQHSVKELLYSIYSICKKGLDEKRFKQEKEPYYKRKIHAFKYDDNGIHIHHWEPEKLLKPVWYEAITVIDQEVKKQEIYHDILTKICAISGWEYRQCSYYLSRLIYIISWNILAGDTRDKQQLDSSTLSLLKDFYQEEQGYIVEAQLDGIVLQPKEIELDGNTLLRKPTAKDIEIEYPIEEPSFTGRSAAHDPTAILESKGVSPSKSIYLKPTIAVSEAVSILRLFRVGGVEYIKFTTHADSLFPAGFLSGEKLRLMGNERYLVKNEDVKHLKTFWSNMKRIALPIPSHTGKQKEPTELSIAYERYSDSLEEGVIEKRISSAVMGLEALYLSPSERQELTYRLSMRAGKLLSQIGYSADKVREELTHAYDIRSTYVHGRTLTPKQRKEHEKKVGELNQFAQTIMDYLRASIVALLNRPSKTSLIDIIDNSFLDSAKDSEIRKLLFAPYEKEELNATG